jgi:hypothetical protein
MKLENRILSGVFTKTLAAAFIIMMLVGVSAAAPTIFFGEDEGIGESTRLITHPNADAARDDFLSHLTNAGIEDLEGFADGTTADLTVDFGTAGTATLQGDGEINAVSTGTNGYGRYPISGNNYWEVTGDFSIEFTEPQVAFGFYGIDIGDYNGQVTIEYESGATEELTIENSVNADGGSVLYFGFIDMNKPFTKVTFGNTASTGYNADVFAFDDFTIGTREQVNNEIPEFPTVAIPIIGIIGMMFLFQRRKE